MAMMKMNWATGRMEAIEFPELKRGQILHCWSGMCGSHYEKAVLIATTKDDFGIHYKAVALEPRRHLASRSGRVDSCPKRRPTCRATPPRQRHIRARA